MENATAYVDQAMNLAIQYAPKLALAIITLLVGLWVIRLIVKGLSKVMARANVEISLQKFLANIGGIILKVLLVISVASMVGIETTSFVAVLAAAGFAVGMALQGGLANFAGGVLILLFKPFKAGDLIEAQGHTGIVDEIQVFHTVLKSLDNKTIIIPNGPLSNNSLVNYSTEATRRVDMVFGIGYGDDIAKTRSVLNRVIAENQQILKDPPADVFVGELADSSVNFTVRVWCKTDDYWNVFFDMHEKVKLAFDLEGISIPYPQQDVHMHQVS